MDRYKNTQGGGKHDTDKNFGFKPVSDSQCRGVLRT